MSDLLSTGVSAIQSRLEAHAVSGGILEGFKVETDPTSQQLGESDLPAVVLVAVSYQESASDNPRQTNSGNVVLGIRLVSPAEDGLSGLLANLASLLDAIETNTSGVVELQVGQSSINGISVTSQDNEATTVGLNILVDVSLGTIPFRRGNRRNE